MYNFFKRNTNWIIVCIYSIAHLPFIIGEDSILNQLR